MTFKISLVTLLGLAAALVEHARKSPDLGPLSMVAIALVWLAVAVHWLQLRRRPGSQPASLDSLAGLAFVAGAIVALL